MAVYGKLPNAKRKRMKLLSDSPIFSSGDEDESDFSNMNVSSNKIEEVKKDKGKITIEKGELLPSAHIIEGEKGRRSSGGNISDTILGEDELTTSPKKYQRIIDSIRSPVRKELPQMESPKKSHRVQVNIAKLASEVSPSNRVSISPRTTPKEKEVWRNLFENMDEVELDYKKDLQKHSIDSGFEDDHVDHDPTLIVPDISSIFLPVDNKISITQTHGINQPKTRNRIQSRRKTYGEVRTYLQGEDEAEGNQYRKENEESIRNYHDFSNDQDDIANINDLRNSGRNQKMNEEVGFLIEGLAFKNSVKLISDNSMLLTSLIDLSFEIIKGDPNILENASEILKILVKILTKLSYINNSSKHIFSWLICVNTFLLIENLENNEYKLKLILGEISSGEDILKGISTNYEAKGLSNLTKSMIEELNGKLPRIQYMKILLIKNFNTIEKFYTWEIYKEVAKTYELNLEETDKLIFLSYFENYFERTGHLESLAAVQLIFEGTIHDLDESKYTQSCLSVMKLLVLVSTNYSDDERISQQIYIHRYAAVMIELINNNYHLMNSNDFSDLRLNIALIALGYLINFCEYGSIRIDQSLLEDHIKSYKSFTHSTAVEINAHLLGYNSILLGHLMLKYDVTIEAEMIIKNLNEFKKSLDHKGIQEKIDNLIEKLN